jgi:predicted secreted protein
MVYNDPGHPVHEAAATLSRVLAGLVDDFKAEQVQSAEKSFSRSCAKPNSSVAALLQRRNYEELLSSLKATAATLLVVPNTLLNHWEVRLNAESQRKEVRTLTHTLSFPASSEASCQPGVCHREVTLNIPLHRKRVRRSL